jgi:hypothetical protein
LRGGRRSLDGVGVVGALRRRRGRSSRREKASVNPEVGRAESRTRMRVLTRERRSDRSLGERILDANDGSVETGDHDKGADDDHQDADSVKDLVGDRGPAVAALVLQNSR